MKRRNWVMLDKTIIETVLSLDDTEQGGDNALDGFEFQVSSAIYLIFNELKNSNNFILLYEKIEDFIIFTDVINLYQAKSTSNSVTPNFLYKKPPSRKKDEYKLSIIEKMNDNYTFIKDKLPSNTIVNNLIICENQIFSKKLSKLSNITELKEFAFTDLSIDVKKDIINNTKNTNYDWDNIKAIRLIPKSRHEEVTRIHIENVITQTIGDNKIKSLSIYNSLTNEIRKIRKEKTTLSREFLLSEINKYADFDNDLKFSDFIHYFDDKDKLDFNIKTYFNSFKNNININNHPNKKDYEKIKLFLTINSLSNIYDTFDLILSSSDFSDLNKRLNTYEIKVLILLAFIKEE